MNFISLLLTYGRKEFQSKESRDIDHSHHHLLLEDLLNLWGLHFPVLINVNHLTQNFTLLMGFAIHQKETDTQKFHNIGGASIAECGVAKQTFQSFLLLNGDV